MTKIITIAREYGSGGAEIARRVADRLGWQFVDRCLIDKIAELAKVPVSVAEEFDERAQSWMERLVAGFTPPAPEVYTAPGPSDSFDSNSMYALTEHVIKTAAQTGNCVIVGRGSQCILRDRSDVLHVFVYAPVDDRIRRLQKRSPREKDLLGLMSDIDRERSSYVHQHYHCAWDDRHLYALCVNSALGVSAATEIIYEATKLAREGQRGQQ